MFELALGCIWAIKIREYLQNKVEWNWERDNIKFTFEKCLNIFKIDFWHEPHKLKFDNFWTCKSNKKYVWLDQVCGYTSGINFSLLD